MALVPVKEEQFIDEEEEEDEREEDDLTTTDQEEDQVVSSLLCQLCGVFVSSEYSFLRTHFEAFHRLTMDKILKDPLKFIKLPKPKLDTEDARQNTLLPLASVLLNLEKNHKTQTGSSTQTKEKKKKRQNTISADDFFFSNRKRKRMVIETVSKQGASASDDPLNVGDTKHDDDELARIVSETSSNAVKSEGSTGQNTTASSNSQIILGDRHSCAEDNCDIDIKEEFIESKTNDINSDKEY